MHDGVHLGSGPGHSVGAWLSRVVGGQTDRGASAKVQLRMPAGPWHALSRETGYRDVARENGVAALQAIELDPVENCAALAVVRSTREMKDVVAQRPARLAGGILGANSELVRAIPGAAPFNAPRLGTICKAYL